MLMPIWRYLRGLVGFAVGAGSRPTYILGHPYSHGVWFYFPVLTFLKSPLAFLLLLALAIAIAVLTKTRRGTQVFADSAGMELHWRSVWVSLVIFTVACMLNRLDISIRHFSIPLALMILLLSPLPRMLDILRRENWGASGCQNGRLLLWLPSRCLLQFAPIQIIFHFSTPSVWVGPDMRW